MGGIVSRGIQMFMGKEIPVIEGGFGEGSRIVSDKTISHIHDSTPAEIRKSINRLVERGRLRENIEYIQPVNCLPVEEFEELARSLGIRPQDISKSKNMFALSERGYKKLIKAMDDDKSWDIMDQFY